MSHKTITLKITGLGLVKKHDIWVSHEFKDYHLTQQICIYDMHLKQNKNDSFLKRIITAYEK